MASNSFLPNKGSFDEKAEPPLQMVTLKKTDNLQPSFDEQLDQSKKATFLLRDQARLTANEGLLFHYVKHGDIARLTESNNTKGEKNYTPEEVNKKNKNGHTSLVVAIEHGKLQIAEILLKEYGAEVNVRFGKDHDTPLHLACYHAANNKDPEKQATKDKMIELLLKHGADYNALNKNLMTPIAYTTGKQKEEFFLDTCIS